MSDFVFKNPNKQAEEIVRYFLRLRESRHEREDDNYIYSVRTKNHRMSSLKIAAQWLREKGVMSGLKGMTRSNAIQFIEERSELVQQKQLNNDRIALNLLFDDKLPKIKSEIAQILSTRAYFLGQIPLIMNHQIEINRISTQVVLAAGLRAHELITLMPRYLQPRSGHRNWREDRFFGREGKIYTVVGKGGLVREVLLPFEISDWLDSKTLPQARFVVDRGVKYQQFYDINGGQKWSQSFSSASKAALGWSNGGHGLRHNYAQSRTTELQDMGMKHKTARLVVSQEMGHFRPEIVSFYYR